MNKNQVKKRFSSLIGQSLNTLQNILNDIGLPKILMDYYLDELETTYYVILNAVMDEIDYREYKEISKSKANHQSSQDNTNKVFERLKHYYPIRKINIPNKCEHV